MEEIEKKYKIAAKDLQHLRESLHKAGFIKGSGTIEENTVYGGLALKDGDIFRIRKEQYDTQSRGTKYILTFKCKPENTLDEGFKRRIEIEAVSNTDEEFKLMLKRLGLQPKVFYEKKREVWLKEGLLVYIDTLPFGLYVEAEGNPLSITAFENTFSNILVVEPRPYPELVTGLVSARFDSQ